MSFLVTLLWHYHFKLISTLLGFKSICCTSSAFTNHIQWKASLLKSPKINHFIKEKCQHRAHTVYLSIVFCIWILANACLCFSHLCVQFSNGSKSRPMPLEITQHWPKTIKSIRWRIICLLGNLFVVDLKIPALPYKIKQKPFFLFYP